MTSNGVVSVAIRTSLTAALALATILGALSLLTPDRARAEEPVTIGGTGAALGPARLLVQAGEARLANYPARVLRSIGSGGAVKAMAAGRVDIGLSQRPPKPEERAEVACAPLMTSVAAFATSEPSLSGATLTRDDLTRLMAGDQTFHGHPIRPILRPAPDADNALLLALAPELGPALEQGRARSGSLVASSHQEALEWAEKVAGSLVMASIDSVRTERRTLYFLHYQGENPLTLPLTAPHPLIRTYYLFHQPNPRPAVRAWIDFLRGPEAAAILGGIGAAAVTGQTGHGC